MNININPIALITTVSLLGTIVCILFACFASRWLIRVTLIMLALVLLLPSALVGISLKPELIDGRLRTYKRFYRDIQVGMPRDQVLELIDQHYPFDSPRYPPMVIKDTQSNLSFFMNSEGVIEPYCEGIFLTMQKDIVVKKKYSQE